MLEQCGDGHFAMKIRLDYMLVEDGRTRFGYIATHTAGRSFLVPKPGMVVVPEDPEMAGRFVVRTVAGPVDRESGRSYLLEVLRMEAK